MSERAVTPHFLLACACGSLYSDMILKSSRPSSVGGGGEGVVDFVSGALASGGDRRFLARVACAGYRSSRPEDTPAHGARAANAM